MAQNKWPKCPKCHKQNQVRLVEHWTNHVIVWDYGTKEDEGILEMGDPSFLMGKCFNCGHVWKFRKYFQIQPEFFEEK